MADQQQQQQQQKNNGFLLASALINGNAPINHSSRQGQTLWHQATQQLPFVFDKKARSLQPFLQATAGRTSEQGWEDIWDMSTGRADALGAPEFKNLPTSCGELNAALDCQTAMLECSLQIHTCLSKSITPEVAKVMVNEIISLI